VNYKKRESTYWEGYEEEYGEEMEGQRRVEQQNNGGEVEVWRSKLRKGEGGEGGGLCQTEGREEGERRREGRGEEGGGVRQRGRQRQKHNNWEDT